MSNYTNVSPSSDDPYIYPQTRPMPSVFAQLGGSGQPPLNFNNTELGDRTRQLASAEQIKSLINYLYGMLELNSVYIDSNERQLIYEIAKEAPLSVQSASLRNQRLDEKVIASDRSYTKSFIRSHTATPQTQELIKTYFQSLGPQADVSLHDIIEMERNPANFIVKAQYRLEKLNGRMRLVEHSVPNPHVYYAYGFISKHNNTKEYRRIIETTLEDSYFMGSTIFKSLEITRGKNINYKAKSFIENLASFDKLFEVAGSFKGSVEVMEDAVLKRLQALDLSPHEVAFYEIPRSPAEFALNNKDRAIMSTFRVSIFLYVLEAEFYENTDIGSENDTYMVVSFGTMRYQTPPVDSTNHPKYCDVFRFDSRFPGASDLKIKFWDRDFVKPDDFLGETVIDLENRFFDRVWNSFPIKPIEKRDIINPASGIPVGSVKLWVDIVPSIDVRPGLYQATNIKPRAAQSVEVRVVIWEVFDVPFPKDDNAIDIYVSCTMPSLNDTQKTDTHFRSYNGYGSFNFRMVYQVTIDQYSKPTDFLLYVKIFDRDIFSPDDYIADLVIDLKDLVYEVYETEERSSIRGLSYDEKTENSNIFKVNPKFK